MVETRTVPLRCSVVIPAYRSESTLPGTLRALQAQTLPRGGYEVLVIDDGSPDRTAEVARPLADRVITVANGGPWIARNIGAEAARGEIVVFTDADCVPEPNFLERLLSAFDDPEIIAAKGTYRTLQREITARFVQFEYEDRYRHMGRFARIDFIDTYAAAFRRGVFLTSGGYSPLFPLASVEDQELGFRLAANGGAMVFVPDAVVTHRHADSPFSYWRKKWKIAFWKVLVLRIHPGKAVRDSHTPQRIKFHVAVTPLLLAGLALGVAGGPWWPAAGALAASMLLERGFLADAWRRDRAVALAAMPLVWGRSLAFAGGMAAGTWRFWWLTAGTDSKDRGACS